MDFSSFLNSLLIMGYGMAGIFVVMGAIFVCISALKNISKK